MANESRQKKTVLLTAAARVAAVHLFFVCLFLGISAAAQHPAESTTQAEDRSLPLWGGGEILSSALVGQMVAENTVKLHHFDQIACGNCHQPPVASPEDSPSLAENG